LSGRGLCDELIIRPEESYRLCCVVVCDLETSRIGAPYIYDISNLRVKRQAINLRNCCIWLVDSFKHTVIFWRGGGIFQENNTSPEPVNMIITYRSNQFKRPKVQF